VKLPNPEYAVVPRAKVVDYLLSDTHRDGQHKAAFFKRFGFVIVEWERLAQALMEHAAEHAVTRVETSSNYAVGRPGRPTFLVSPRACSGANFARSPRSGAMEVSVDRSR